MADRQLGGVLSAVATPFTSDGSAVDAPALRRLVEATIGAGIHGLVPCGSTGEFTSLSSDERRHVAEVVIDAAAGRVPVVPHTGAMTTAEAVALSRHAQAAGATAVMAVAPYYEPLSLDELRGYYLDLSAAIDIPIMLYNLPVATGHNLTGDWLIELARESGRIRYIKDTSGDLSQAQRLVAQHGHELGIFVGWDTLLGSAFLAGAAGTVVGAANVIPAAIVEVWEHVAGGRAGEAVAAWRRILPLMDFLVSGGYNAAIKVGMEIVGLDAGPLRAPVRPLPAERRAQLAALLGDLGVTVSGA